VSEGVATDQFFGNGRVPQMVQVLVVAVEDDRDTISAAREVLGVEWLMDITFFPRQLLRVPILSQGSSRGLTQKMHYPPQAQPALLPLQLRIHNPLRVVLDRADNTPLLGTIPLHLDSALVRRRVVRVNPVPRRRETSLFCVRVVVGPGRGRDHTLWL
jgi:hypothetical protein